jgi:hypothetical protein
MDKLYSTYQDEITSLEELIQRCNTEKNRDAFSLSDFTNFCKSPPRELFEKMIVFLSMRHTEGEKFTIKSRAGWICEVEMDTNSGFAFDSILKNTNGIILYLGMGTFYQNPNITKYPTFLIMDDKGVSYWDNIKDIQTAINEGDAIPYGNMFCQPLKNVRSKEKILNFGNLLTVYQENNLKSDKILLESMDILSDAVIQCRDGDVKIVRYLFAKNSEFFLHLFRYESTKREFKMDFDKTVLQTYMDYHLYLVGAKNPNVEKICEDVMQYIEFGFFIQDIHFVKTIYNLVIEDCDDHETLVKLNDSIRKIASFD